MMTFNESKAEDRIYPKPPARDDGGVDYITSFVSAGILMCMVMKLPLNFFICVTIFISRCLTTDGEINWMKMSIPFMGLIPAVFKLVVEILQCLWTGTPL